MHSAKLLYVDGNSVTHLVNIDAKDIVDIVGVQRYTDFDNNKGLLPNGSYPCLNDKSFNELYGKLLTLVDATFTDVVQREAHKNIVRSTLSEWYDKQVGFTFKSAEKLFK